MSDAFTPNPQATAPVEQAVTPVAPPAPSAAPAPLPWEVPASQPEVAQPPVQQAAPESAGEPTPPQSPAPTGPSPDELERLRQQAAQFEELQRRVREEQERLAREAEANARTEEFNRKANEIWDLAQRFDTDEERRSYYNRQMAALRTETEQFYRHQIEAERAQIQQQEMAQLLAGYPDWLKREFDLDDADVEVIRTLGDADQMTAMAKLAKSYKQRYGTLQQTVDQAYANSQAAHLRQTVTSGNISGAPGERQELAPFRAGDPEGRAVLARFLGLGS